MTCTVEGYPLNNVRWYFNQVDFNIETEIQTDQFHKVDTIIQSTDSIKTLLIIRNVNQDHFGDYKIRVEGGTQEIIERVITLKPMNPEDVYGNHGNPIKLSYLFMLSILGLVVFLNY